MPANFELKARCADLVLARERAEAVATRWLGVDRQVDTYFRTARGRFKLREIALYQNVRIHLDWVEGLGDFVELEAVWDGDLAGEDEQREKVAHLRAQLDIGEADLVAASYEGLLDACTVQARLCSEEAAGGRPRLRR